MKIAFALWLTCTLLCLPALSFSKERLSWREQVGIAMAMGVIVPVTLWLSIVGMIYLWSWALG